MRLDSVQCEERRGYGRSWKGNGECRAGSRRVRTLRLNRALSRPDILMPVCLDTCLVGVYDSC